MTRASLSVWIRGVEAALATSQHLDKGDRIPHNLLTFAPAQQRSGGMEHVGVPG